MATYTTHYNLKKPALADKIRISDFNGNADIIDGQMYDNASLGAQLKADIGIVENTNTATHNISAGEYVIWKGSLYIASSAISSGATLSSANLSTVSGGGLNLLNSNIGQFLSAVNLPSGITSFNNLTTPGRYGLYGTSLSDAPASGLYGYVDVIIYATNFIAQNVWAYTGSGFTIYSRRRNESSVWSSWATK